MIEIIPPAWLARLEGYRLGRQAPLRGNWEGEHRSRQTGGGVELADYRDYSPGDDPRRVDWAAYARLGRLYVKEMQADRRDLVVLLLDNSASLAWAGLDPVEEGSKARLVRQVAAGLAVCALAGQDALALVATGDKLLLQPPLTGLPALPSVLRFLANLRPGGQADLVTAVRQALATWPRSQSLYLLSDLLEPGGGEKALQTAAAAGLNCTVLQILAPGELHPGGEGEWELWDCEEEGRLAFSLTPAALAAYALRLAQHQEQVAAACRRYGAARLLLSSGSDPWEVLFRHLPGAGIIHPR